MGIKTQRLVGQAHMIIEPGKSIPIWKSMSACINAPGMSRTTTSRFSKASITAVRNTASVLTVGAVDSSLAMYALCFRPSAHPRPFTFPAAFSLEEHEISQCLLPLF